MRKPKLETRSDWGWFMFGILLATILIGSITLLCVLYLSDPSGVYTFPPDERGCVKIEERREIFGLYEIRKKVKCP